MALLEAAAPGIFTVRALVAGRDVVTLAAQARAHRAELAVVADEGSYAALKEALAGTGIAVLLQSSTAVAILASGFAATWMWVVGIIYMLGRLAHGLGMDGGEVVGRRRARDKGGDLPAHPAVDETGVDARLADVDLRLLRVFRAVAEAGGLSAALPRSIRRTASARSARTMAARALKP
jgi:uncharacterized membrane protein YecN with MAPEG domain